MKSNDERHHVSAQSRQQMAQGENTDFVEQVELAASIPSALTTLGLSQATSYLEIHAEYLTVALAHRNWSIRTAAVQALGKQQKPTAIKPLVHALHDENAAVRATAARSLGLQGKRAPIEPLVEALHDPAWRVRTAATLALGRCAKRTPREPLAATLHDEHPSVRAAAVWALGTLGAHTPIELLVTALHDKDWSVREAAVMALKEQGERAPAAQLFVAQWDEDRNVRDAAETLPMETLYEGYYGEQSGQKLASESARQAPSSWLRMTVAVASVVGLGLLSTLLADGEYVGRFALISKMVALGVVCLAIMLINIIYQRRRAKSQFEPGRKRSGIGAALTSWQGVILAITSIIVLIVITPSLLTTYFFAEMNMTADIIRFVLICKLIVLGYLALTVVALNFIFHRKA